MIDTLPSTPSCKTPDDRIRGRPRPLRQISAGALPPHYAPIGREQRASAMWQRMKLALNVAIIVVWAFHAVHAFCPPSQGISMEVNAKWREGSTLAAICIAPTGAIEALSVFNEQSQALNEINVSVASGIGPTATPCVVETVLNPLSCHPRDAVGGGAPRAGTAECSIARLFRCPSSSTYHRGDELRVVLTDTWAARAAGVEWNTSVASTEARMWTTEIADAFAVGEPIDRFWVGATDGSLLTANHSTLDPIGVSSIRAPRRVWYGLQVESPLTDPRHSVMPRPAVELPGTPRPEPNNGSTPVPVVSYLADEEPGWGLSLVQRIANAPPNAFLDIDAGGHSSRWTRQWYRLGGDTANLTLSRVLLLHESCWRPALDYLVSVEPASMLPDVRVNATSIAGGGSYADYRGEADRRNITSSLGASYAEQLHTMNYQLNWEPTANFAPSHGLWMPYNLTSGEPLPNGTEWTGCIGTPDFARYYYGDHKYVYEEICWDLGFSTLQSYSSDLRSYGFTPMMYGNYWEFGWNGESTLALACSCQQLTFNTRQ